MTNFDVKAIREKALQSDDIINEEYYVREWDVTLPIRTLSSTEMKAVMKSENDHVRSAVLAIMHGCKTPDGKRVFGDKDLAHLENKSFGVISKISERIIAISGGLDDEEVGEAKND